MAERIPPNEWVQRVQRAKDEGYVFLANLTAVDEVGVSDDFRVVLWLERPEDGQRIELDTLVPRGRPSLADLTPLFAGASWLQRQIHDLFGVVFEGADDRPLVYAGGDAPLRKDYLLRPRLDQRWPGALEPGESGASPSRRKLVPPGVPDPAILADPDATPADIALSATGSRVRRRG